MAHFRILNLTDIDIHVVWRPDETDGKRTVVSFVSDPTEPVQGECRTIRPKRYVGIPYDADKGFVYRLENPARVVVIPAENNHERCWAVTGLLF